jgi:farnesyl diphosphate synthase
VINSYVERQEQFLKQFIEKATIPATPIRSALAYALFSGGKRIRPTLIYLIGNLVQVPLTVLDVIAAAVELTHCYSLIHDDLPAMDNDDMRRGKPSCHKAFDEATAILVGDGMQALAIELLSTRLVPLLEAAQVLEIIAQLVHACGISGMVSGQSLDLCELSKPNLTEEQLTQIHHLKTGKMICACVEMVMSAQISIPEQTQSALRTYAKHLGLVFQMQDDYLDRYAPSTILGKGRSSDHANDKTTFATLCSKEELEHKISRHYQMALTSLNLCGPNAEALIALTHQLEARTRLD